MVRLGSLIGLLVALVAAAPAVGADTARIAGTTTIGAGQAGYVPVQLEQPLRVVIASNDREEMVQVKVDGGGLYGGMLLRLDDPSPDAPGLLALRTPTFDHAFPSPVGETSEESSDSAWAVTLPAGRYRLYAIASDKPVAVTMTLPGLPGVADLRPTVAVPAVGEAFQRRDPLPADNVVVAGQAHTLVSAGLVSYELLSDSLVGAVHQVELCRYPPGSDSSAPDAFTPGCPGGEAFSDLPAAGYAGYGLGSNDIVGPGEWGLGGNAEAVSVPAETAGYGLWMDFDGTPIPGATIPGPPGSAPPPPAPAPAPSPPSAPASTGGATAGSPPAAKRPAKRRAKKKRCPRVTRRSSRAQRRKAARCRAAQRRAARRRG